VLANAKKKADENSGYFVFDESGNAVYPEKYAAEYSTYTVVSGDSLWRIAARLLGDGRKYPEIKKLNGLTSDIIHAGQKLKIPGSSALKVGDMVKVTASRYATGETVPGWVKERAHKVSRIEKDKVLLGWPDGIASWLPIDGVKKALA
jgi:LysM repeat protein